MRITTLMLMYELLQKEYKEAEANKAAVNEERKQWELENDATGWEDKPKDLHDRIINANERCIAAHSALNDFEEHEWG